MKDKLDKLPRLCLDALFIICCEDDISAGRLLGIEKDRMIFSLHEKYSVGDTFTAGFRVNGDFIMIKRMRKTWERQGEEIIEITAEISEIEAAEELKLNNLLTNRSYSHRN